MFIGLSASAQRSVMANDPTPQATPNSNVLEELAEIPVDLSSGRPFISLPLGSIDGLTAKLNVGAVYDPSGRKVDELSSFLGLGWNLSIGGIITRTVHGLPDEMQPIINSQTNEAEEWTGGFFSLRNDYESIYQSSSVNSVMVNNSELRKLDLEPDQYNFSFPGGSGQFVFDIHKNIFQLEKSDNTIQMDGNLSSFTIIDASGNKYYFGSCEKIWFDTHNWLTVEDNLNLYFPMAWYLTEVRNANNELEYEIEYENDPTIYHKTERYHTLSLTCLGSGKPIERNSESYIQALRPKQINGNTLSMLFVYDHLRPDYPNAMALSEIKLVQNNNNGLVQRVLFKYDYDGSNPEDLSRNNPQLELTKVLFYDRNEEVIESRSINYKGGFPNTSNQSVYGCDYWKLYNGNNAGNLIPELGGGITEFSDHELLVSDSENRHPNPEFAMSGMIESIADMSGLRVDYEFELNEYNREANSNIKYIDTEAAEFHLVENDEDEVDYEMMDDADWQYNPVYGGGDLQFDQNGDLILPSVFYDYIPEFDTFEMATDNGIPLDQFGNPFPIVVQIAGEVPIIVEGTDYLSQGEFEIEFPQWVKIKYFLEDPSYDGDEDAAFVKIEWDNLDDVIGNQQYWQNCSTYCSNNEIDDLIQLSEQAEANDGFILNVISSHDDCRWVTYEVFLGTGTYKAECYNPSSVGATQLNIFYQKLNNATIKTSKQGGGLRIKSITSFDLTGQEENLLSCRAFKYQSPNGQSSGVLNTIPKHYTKSNTNQNCGFEGECFPCPIFNISSVDQSVLLGDEPMKVTYQHVQEYRLNNEDFIPYKDNGVLPVQRVEFDFRVEIPGSMPGLPNGYFQAQHPWKNGAITSSRVYNSENQIMTAKTFDYIEKEFEQVASTGFNVVYYVEDFCTNEDNVVLKPYKYYSSYYLRSEEKYFGHSYENSTVQTITRQFTYGINNSSLLTDINVIPMAPNPSSQMHYTYIASLDESNAMLQPGESFESYGLMKVRGMLNYPVEVTSCITPIDADERIVSSKLIEYKILNGSIILPSKEFYLELDAFIAFDQLARFETVNNTIVLDSRYKLASENISFDENYFLQESADQIGVRTSVIYGDENNKPLAACENSALTNMAYSSFEDANHGGWIYTDNNIQYNTEVFHGLQFPNGKTGYNYLNLGQTSISKELAPGVYRLSAWVKNEFGPFTGQLIFTLPTNISVELVSNEDPDNRNWKYIEYKVTVSSSNGLLIIPHLSNANVLIDELRLNPLAARMTTICYNLDGSIQSTCDINNNCLYYFYDAVNRIKWKVNNSYDIVSGYEYFNRNPNNGIEKGYIKSYIPTVPDLSTNQVLSAGSSSTQALINLSYVDAANRVVQSIQLGQAVQNKNFVQFREFDALGKETKLYDPYAAMGNEHYIENVKQAQLQFYANSSHVEHTSFPFKEIVFDKSPLSLVVAEGSQGEAWQVSNGHAQQSKYSLNSSNEVILWRYNDIRIITGDGSNAEYWPQGALTKVEGIDEDGKQMWLFSNARGQVVLKRLRAIVGQQIGTSDFSGVTLYTSDMSMGTSGSHPPLINQNVINVDTYYIYDDLGALMFEMPPIITKGLQEIGDYYMATVPGGSLFEYFNQYCFAYKYDQKGRLVQRKIPGMDWSYIVYNEYDQVVLTQDADERITNSWNYLKYDELGRVIIVGQTNSALSFEDLATYLSNENLVLFEQRSEEPLSLHGYTNQSFPTSLGKVLTVNYYDDYEFDQQGHECLLPNKTNRTLNFVTGSKVLILGTSNYLWSITHYNKESQVLQSWSTNMTGGYSSTVLDYSFLGQIRRTVETSKFNTDAQELTTVIFYNYDKGGRLLNTKQKNNNDPEITLNKFHYNELSQVIKKEIHIPTGMDVGMQTIDYRYNERGWIKSINNKELADDGDNLEDYDVFGEELTYIADGISGDPLNEFVNTNLTLTSHYSGNVAMFEWKVKTPDAPQNQDGHNAYIFRYDDLGRITNAVYAKYDPTQFNLGLDYGKYSEKVDYDLSGNIISLTRNRSDDEQDVSSDNLKYTYSPLGYKLLNVTESGNSTANENFTHFIDGSNTGNDYEYDVMGRMTKDRNKGLNYTYDITGQLNHVSNFELTENVHYTYNAQGTKLSKNQGGTIIYYFNGAEYNQDGSIILVPTSEGCFRPTPQGSTNTTEFVYDYNILDHLGNVRVTLTEENATEETAVATLEPANINLEDLQFENLLAAKVDKPVDWSVLSNFNTKVAQLSTSGYSMGPSHIAKVMLGERVEVNVESFYRTEGENSGTGQTLSQIFGSLLVSLTVQGAGILPSGESGIGAFSDASSQQSMSVAQFLMDNTDQLDNGTPSAQLVYILFDRYLRINRTFSGVINVNDPDEVEILLMAARDMPHGGYFFTYVTNQSPKMVYFNDLTIKRKVGVIRSAYDYYPYGLSWYNMDTSELRNAGYQGKDFQSSVSMYDFEARMLDPVLARWISPDPVASTHNVYQSMRANPVLTIDPTGMTDGWIQDENGEMYWDENINSQGDWTMMLTLGGESRNYNGALGIDYIGQQVYGSIGDMPVVFNADGTIGDTWFMEAAQVEGKLDISEEDRKHAEEETANYIYAQAGMPVYYVYEDLTPEIYAHTKLALKKNPTWKVLHYNGGGKLANSQRYYARKNKPLDWLNIIGNNMEEFPPASTWEGGRKAWVISVPIWENCIQGGQLGAIMRNMEPNDAFAVVLVPKVTKPIKQPVPSPVNDPIIIPITPGVFELAKKTVPSQVMKPSFSCGTVFTLIFLGPPGFWTDPMGLEGEGGVY